MSLKAGYLVPRASLDDSLPTLGRILQTSARSSNDMRSSVILFFIAVFFFWSVVAQDADGSGMFDTPPGSQQPLTCLTNPPLSTDSAASPTTDTSAPTDTSSDASTTLTASSAPMTSSTGYLGTSGIILPISPPSTDPTGRPGSQASSRSTHPTSVGPPPFGIGLSSSRQNNGSRLTRAHGWFGAVAILVLSGLAVSGMGILGY